uniref:Centrosomal protein 57kDa-like protein 1 n=1 Tax=Salvator merianae TaxID=96440 RepID=A0A8D0C818_SALMN
MESLDTESKHSYIGSFHQPPDKIHSAIAYFRPKRDTAIRKDIPAPNHQALVAALKTLQAKIHHLELERSQAEDDLNCLSREAAQHKKVLQQESNEKEISYQELMQERKDVTLQLRTAQSRCFLLEKQLDYMRKMVVSAELEKRLVLEQQTELQKEKDQDQLKLCTKLDKLEILEKECWQLTGTQKTAEEKIKYLEQKLQEEQHQRKLIQDKAAQLQTGVEMNRILMSSLSPQKMAKKSKKKKVVKKNRGLKKGRVSQLHQDTGMLPFVAGKSASSSHSVTANVQSVLHMMKYRSPRVTSQHPEEDEGRISRWTRLCKAPTSCSEPSSATENLFDLLLALQDELGQMSFEHQELLKQIQDTQNHNIQEDLERELDCIVKKMEVKGDQIYKLKKHQENVNKLRQKAEKLKKKAITATSKSEELKATKDIPDSLRGSINNISSVNKNTSSLRLLKNAQKLQSVLKKDDIMWER